MKQAIREAVEDAVSRFSGATNEIRQSANEIREELNSTRSEIKKGIFDLPEETRESTAAMRNAVSEQIKALQDLSAIVEHSSHMLDHSGPQDKPAKQKPVAPAPVEASTPAPSVVELKVVEKPVAEAKVAEAPVAQVEVPVSQNSESRMDLRGGMGVMQSSSQSGQQATQQVTQQATQKAASKASLAPVPVPAPTDAVSTPARKPQGEGWVRDLLRSASRQQDGESNQPPRGAANSSGNNARNRNPRQVVESLNSLSVDIARAIDHDASVELWRRYQSGERDIFTRRLYTLKGQKTFEEIKSKYAREPEFTTAVDHYIADFEKLLADVAKNDRDKVITQTYLTSDTGKVYTMLAHASGRLK